MQLLFRWLASGVDLAHALLMLGWGLGLPLLFWHRWPKLSRAYVWFSIGFVGASVLSQLAIGECVLTTLARRLWTLAGGYRDDVPFVVTCVNAVARIRPSTRAAVFAWQLAVAISALGVAWHFAREGRGRGSIPAPVQRGAGRRPSAGLRAKRGRSC
jgi:hypothetical protein